MSKHLSLKHQLIKKKMLLIAVKKKSLENPFGEFLGDSTSNQYQNIWFKNISYSNIKKQMISSLWRDPFGSIQAMALKTMTKCLSFKHLITKTALLLKSLENLHPSPERSRQKYLADIKKKIHYVQTIYKSFSTIATNSVKVIAFNCYVFSDKVKLLAL